MQPELEASIRRGHYKKAKKILHGIVSNNDQQYVALVQAFLQNDLPPDGNMQADLARAFFRLSRTSLSDCAPLFLLQDVPNHNVQEALLEVLGYDRMVPPVAVQHQLIERFFHFGDGLDYRYYSDPRYGLAAACAQWEATIVRGFLLHCLTVGDAPLRFVAENALKRKTVKLRAHS